VPTPPAALREQRVVRGREDLRDAARHRPVHAVRDGHELALMHHAQLGLAAAAHDRHDAVAHREARRARPQRGDLAGELEPGDVRRRAGRRGVAAGELEHVRAVDPGAADADQDLARAGLRVGMLGDGDLAVTDRRCAHGRGS
jgi:hypothetical protein